MVSHTTTLAYSSGLKHPTLFVPSTSDGEESFTRLSHDFVMLQGWEEVVFWIVLGRFQVLALGLGTGQPDIATLVDIPQLLGPWVGLHLQGGEEALARTVHNLLIQNVDVAQFVGKFWCQCCKTF